MNATYEQTAGYDFVRPRSRHERMARLDRVAALLDTAFVIPGTGVRFGVDAVIGLVPGLGDVVTTALALWLVYEAHRLGAPRQLLARMLGNVALDGFLGAAPVVGDVFDVLWRANRRNARLLRNWMNRDPLARSI